LSSEGAGFLLFVDRTATELCRGGLLPAGGWIESGRRAFRSYRVDVTSGSGAGRRSDRHCRVWNRGRRGTGGRGRRVDRRGGSRGIAARNRGLGRHGSRGQGDGRSLHSRGNGRWILGRPIDRSRRSKRAAHERPAGRDADKCEK